MFTVDKFMSRSDFELELLQQNKGTPYNRKNYQEHLDHMEGIKNNNDNEFVFEAAQNRQETHRKIENFSETLYDNLLTECLCSVFDRVVAKEKPTQHEMAIGHSMISKLIKEEGVHVLLGRFEHKNLILSEFARYTDKYHKIAMEAVKDKVANDQDDDSYAFDKDVAEKFIDDVKDLVPDRVVDIIRDRVEDSIQTFIDQNTENKIAIKDIYLKAKMNVDKASDDTIKEEFTSAGKVQAARIYDRPTNVFGAMVNAIGEAVHNTPVLKEEYMDGTKIKMEHLCNDVQVMYTVLEMANTLRIVDVNENYIAQAIADLKKW